MSLCLSCLAWNVLSGTLIPSSAEPQWNTSDICGHGWVMLHYSQCSTFQGRSTETFGTSLASSIESWGFCGIWLFWNRAFWFFLILSPVFDLMSSLGLDNRNWEYKFRTLHMLLSRSNVAWYQGGLVISDIEGNFTGIAEHCIGQYQAQEKL